MPAEIQRGALIVLEGCDRSGKSTQCKRLTEALNNDGINAELVRFPERSTTIGHMINDYLSRKCELEDHVIHLLFAANRWELAPRMKELLTKGTTLIVDRYSFSGVAFSAAKQGVDMKWCKGPEIGLPQPDAVLYLNLSPEEAAKRAAFGGERYEQTEFQEKVEKNYSQLKDDYWKEVDASKSVDDLHQDIFELAKEIIKSVDDKPIGELWRNLLNVDINEQELARKKHRLDNQENGSVTSNGCPS